MSLDGQTVVRINPLTKLSFSFPLETKIRSATPFSNKETLGILRLELQVAVPRASNNFVKPNVKVMRGGESVRLNRPLSSSSSSPVEKIESTPSLPLSRLQTS
jgi:hypothetical protein